jgi:cold shock CspA family protein
MRGTMIWFNEDKDHGYIATEDGERLYVAGQDFKGGRLPEGRVAGLVVEFEVNENNGTRGASEVVLVDELDPPRARLRRGARVR